ncbi:hypothetical protein [Campylobacter concisus]|uniref:hypothetical protein n=1 Tax=Campylobacter concisus TaxID=199 RepID=UPI0011E82C75|nr:hypothetical protein [Campylobacter concisus]
MAFARQILLASYQIYASLKHFMRCSFLTNFCWRGGYGFEAWLNFTRVASIPPFLELFIEILSKEPIWRQIVERSMRDYLAMKKFAANALRAKNFIALATST